MLQTNTVPATVGCRGLCAELDRIVLEGGAVERVVAAVEQSLRRLINDGGVSLAPALRERRVDSYARRLIHKSPDLGYCVVAMVWAPGQGTRLHDHAGEWCVEAVLEGRLEVSQYELLERVGERCRFVRRSNVTAAVGSAGCLIPPFEYHVMRNPDAARDAITIHVYGHELERCAVFDPVPGTAAGDAGWYLQAERQLGYTA